MVQSKVVRQMRQMAAAGASPHDVLIETLKSVPDRGRIAAIMYFQEAFCLSLPDAQRVAAADAFGERLSADEFDREIGRMIEAGREQWTQPRPTDRAA
jgi:hypothetical protein